jgi:hypothetical protein
MNTKDPRNSPTTISLFVPENSVDISSDKFSIRAAMDLADII